MKENEKKIWAEPGMEDLMISFTQNYGNNNTNIHKGWCAMHKNPENGVCTCGAFNIGQS